MTVALSNSLPEIRLRERRIPNTRWFGVEFYEPQDPLLQWAASYIEMFRGPEKSLVVETGGASGFKAMELARLGCDVLIIETSVDQETRDIISNRNYVLKRESSANGKIILHEADVKSLSNHALSKLCSYRSPIAFTAFMMPHFLDEERGELNRFFSLMASQANHKSILCISYLRQSRWANTNDKSVIYHDPNRVVSTAAKSSFHLAAQLPEGSGREYGVTRQVFSFENRSSALAAG